MKSQSHKFPVTEIFGPTIQGEGLHVGRRAIFVRFAGCDSQCSWCDTKYSWDDKLCDMLTACEIQEKIESLSKKCSLVILTGGNPALQNLDLLTIALAEKGFEIHVETQGTLAPEWFLNVNLVVVSPKATMFDLAESFKIVDRIKTMAPVHLKIVIFTDSDYEIARAFNERYPKTPMTLQVGYAMGHAQGEALTKLGEKMMADENLSECVRVLPQMHRLMWGGRRGV